MRNDKVYRLSTGEIVKDYPNLLSERDELIKQAKGIERILSHTRKIHGKELQEIWLNDPNVLEYRELLRKVWGFVPPVQVVEEIPCCEYCKKWDKKLYILDYSLEYPSLQPGGGITVYSYVEVRCRECALDKRNVWRDEFVLHSIKTYQEEECHQK